MFYFKFILNGVNNNLIFYGNTNFYSNNLIGQGTLLFYGNIYFQLTTNSLINIPYSIICCSNMNIYYEKLSINK